MSILTLDKNEALSTFNRHVPSGHIDKLKAASDAKSNTDELTQANTALPSSHGAAFQSVSAIKSDNDVARAAVDVDSAAYFDEYDLGDIH